MVSEFGNYPGYGSWPGYGTITILDPCATPNSLTVGSPQDVDTDGSSPAVFTFPDYTVDPPQCKPVFSCSYLSGEYTGNLLDSCNYDSVSINGGTQLTFNTQTG